jgi:hypothetical protein
MEEAMEYRFPMRRSRSVLIPKMAWSGSFVRLIIEMYSWGRFLTA